MAKKTKYVIVRLISAISNASRIWVRHRNSPGAKVLLFDPAIGKEVLFVEKEHVKGIDNISKNIIKRYDVKNLGDVHE